MPNQIKVLMVEDVETDAEIEIRELKRAGMTVEYRRVETGEDFRRTVPEFRPDVILSDFSMPGFDGMAALKLARELCPDTPFIFVSGTLGEEYAIRALRNGATDYVVKTNLIRLPAAVTRAVEEARGNAARRAVEMELRVARERLESIFTTFQDVIWSADAVSRTLFYISPAATQVFGHTPEAFLADAGLWIRTIHADDLNRVMAEWSALGRDGSLDVEYRIVLGDGSVRWISDRGRLVSEGEGKPARIDGIARDITERVEQRQRIARLNRIREVMSGINTLIVRVRTRDELFREACRVAVDAGKFGLAWIGTVDWEQMRITPVASSGLEQGYVENLRMGLNDADPANLGLTGRAVLERKPIVINDILGDPLFPFKRQAAERNFRSAVFLPLLISGKAVGAIALYAEVPGFFTTEELKLLTELAGDISFALDHIEKEERLNYLAFHDALTGLPNRNLLHERITQHAHAASRDKRKLAVIVLDIERFRIINDSLGRAAADDLLKQIVERCLANSADPDMFARIGADQFAELIPDVKADDEVARQSLLRYASIFGPPYRVDDHELSISARFGISLFPADGADAEQLLGNAETALQKAKLGGERHLYYAQQMNERVAENLALENKLRRALENDEFVLHYQPKIAFDDGRIVGVEALIRWQSPELGLVPPMKFIPLMEETGIILEAGAWALRRAIRDYDRWREQGLDAPRVAVNVSPIQLRQRDFVSTVEQAVGQSAAGHGLDLEITESLIMEDIEGNVEKLKAIRIFGINIAIDDFGTGYSSLAYLAKLPVQTLKIDRAFVITMLKDPNAMTLVSTMITLAHSLGLKVVAEGVDEEAQATMLRSLRCDEMQGYLFSKPLPLDAMTALLKKA